MAIRLPGADALSATPSGQSGRPIADIDTTGIGRGMESFGRGIQSAGGNFMRMAEDQREKSEQVDTYDAATRFNDFQTKWKQQTAETAQNMTPGGAGTLEAFTPKYKADAEAFYGALPEHLKAKYKPVLHAFEGQLTGSLHGDVLAEENRFATNGQIQLTNKLINQAAANPNDPQAQKLAEMQAAAFIRANPKLSVAEKDRQLASLHDDIAKGVGIPLIQTKEGNRALTGSPIPQANGGGAQSDREAQAMSYFTGRGYSKAQAAGIVGNLIHESAGLKAGIKNPGDGSDGSDSIGIGQWNGPRATALKNFAASQGKDWHDYGVQLAFVDHELNTNYGGVKARLLAAKSPDDAAGVIVTGYERPRGSQSGAEASHGWSNRRDQARRLAGGEYAPGDATASTPVADTYTVARQRLQERFGDNTSPDVLDALARGAVTAKNQFAVETRSNIEQAGVDAPAAIQNTGQYSGTMPTAQDFHDAYGAEAGRKQATFEAAVETSKAVFDMKTQSNADIAATLQRSTPVQTGEGAAVETARYSALQQAASQIMKARESDPAGYVQQAFPVVKQAWTAYSANPSDPQAYSNALTATAAAQQQLGIAPEKQRILPGSIADGIVEKLKMKDLEPSKALATLGQAVFATNDPLQQEAIFDQLKKAGVPAEAEGAIRALHQGRTGDARFLMEAVTAKDVPWGTGDEKPGAINDAIAAAMSSGSPAGVLYGLDAGSTDNLDRYQADRNLFTNAVKLKMLGGKTSASAITEVQKALYGGARVVDQGHVKLTLPENVDADAVVTGLGAQLPAVKEALDHWGMVTPAGASPTQKREAQFQQWDRAARINDIATNTGVWRNLGSGYGFMDATTGLFVAGKDGKPLVVTDDDLTAAAKVQANAAAVQGKAAAVEAAKPITAIPLGASGESIKLTPDEVTTMNPAQSAPAPVAAPAALAPKVAAVDQKPTLATTAVDKAPTSEPFNPKDHVSLGAALKPYSNDAVHIAKAAWKFLHPPEPGPIDWKEMQKAIDPWMPESPVAQEKILEVIQGIPKGQHLPGFNKGHDDPLLRHRMRPKGDGK